MAAVNSVIYWISNPIWVGGSLTIYAGKHGVHGFGGHAFLPTYAIFIAVVPVLLFNYAGLEVPSAAGEEMVNPVRDVPKAVGWSGITTFFAYGIPILAILIVLPQSQVSGLTGFLLSVKAVFTVYGGSVSASGVTLTGAGLVLGRIVAVVFIFALASAGTTWIMGSDRNQAVACGDGAGPRIFSRFSRSRPTTARRLRPTRRPDRARAGPLQAACRPSEFDQREGR